MTVTRQQVKQLLKSKLSGRETAILVLQDAWEKDHGRDGFLADAEIQRLKRQVKLPQDIGTYNSLIELYRIMTYTLQSIRISALQTVGLLEGAVNMLTEFYLLSLIKRLGAVAPAIMTEKQHQDVKAKQRERLLQTISSLGEALAYRALELASEEQQREAGSDMWTLALQHPELLSQAVSDYQGLIQAGTLKPVILTEQQIQRYQKALGQEEEARQALQAEPPDEYSRGWLSWYREHFPDGSLEQETLERDARLAYSRAEMVRLSLRTEQTQALYRELHQEGLRRWSQRHAQRALAGLETLKEHPGLIDVDEHPELDWLLSWTCLSGEQLYQAGLSEQIAWVDEYKPGLFEGDPIRVAILLEPASYDLDEQGHYKGPDVLGQIDDFFRITALERRVQEQGSSLGEFFQDLATGAKDRIRDFLASQAVTEAVSKAVDIPFDQDTEADFAQIQESVKRYNLLAKGEELLPSAPDLGLSQIRIARMRPKQEQVQYLRERVALALGDRWWQEIKGLEQSFEQQAKDQEEG